MTSIADVVGCARVLVSPVDVNEALTVMGLRIEDLHAAIDAGETDRDSCTLFNPPPDAGNRAHGTTVRLLRELYVPQGWGFRNHQNLSTIVSPDEEIEIAVGSGDDATANPDRTPQSKYRKGDLVLAGVAANRRQLSLAFPGTSASEQLAPIIWVLLRHPQERIVRCELSIPTSVASDNKIVFEGTRIILPDLDLNPGGGIRSRDDGSSSVDVTVVRRRA